MAARYHSDLVLAYEILVKLHWPMPRRNMVEALAGVTREAQSETRVRVSALVDRLVGDGLLRENNPYGNASVELLVNLTELRGQIDSLRPKSKAEPRPVPVPKPSVEAVVEPEIKLKPRLRAKRKIDCRRKRRSGSDSRPAPRPRPGAKLVSWLRSIQPPEVEESVRFVVSEDSVENLLAATAQVFHPLKVRDIFKDQRHPALVEVRAIIYYLLVEGKRNVHAISLRLDRDRTTIYNAIGNIEARLESGPSYDSLLAGVMVRIRRLWRLADAMAR